MFYGVTSTKIYCRPGCPARRPKPENIRYFATCDEAEGSGFRACKRCHPKETVTRSEDAILRVCRHLEANAEEPPSLAVLSRLAKLSRFHLLREFKKTTGMTPRGYAALCRVREFKKGLKAGHSVTRAMVDAGYGSSSRLYEKSNKELGMTPRAYRNGGLGERIRFSVVNSPLGKMLVAATGKGVCATRFGDKVDELERSLKNEFPFAEIERDDVPLMSWVEQLNRHLTGEERGLKLPLDIRATVFQRKVWDILAKIPYGETRTYTEVAKEAGRPKAVRAVANACATNPVAVAVPCHRVLRSDGSLGGYRWGLSRKVQLLEAERAVVAGQQLKQSPNRLRGRARAADDAQGAAQSGV